MEKGDVMKVDVSRIVKSNGCTQDIDLIDNVKNFDLDIGDIEFGDKFEFKGIVTNSSGILRLEGILKVNYLDKCSRCLKDIDRELSIKIQEEFVESSKATEDDEYTYDGNLININKALKDNVMLNVPFSETCKSTCKGLCPGCGANLNEGSCLCENNVVDSRLVVLKDFFNDKK